MLKITTAYVDPSTISRPGNAGSDNASAIERPPRSPRVRLGGYVLLPRMLDKGRALLNGEELTAFPPIYLQPGDVVELQLGGGGGFGPVEERDPAAVRRDVELGLVTPAAAGSEYGVAVEPTEAAA